MSDDGSLLNHQVTDTGRLYFRVGRMEPGETAHYTYGPAPSRPDS